MLQFAKKATLIDLAQTLLRSWWTFVAAGCLGLAGGIVAVQNAPKLYEATTKVWMSQPALPNDVAETTVKEDLTRRLITFTEADLSQAYMLKLIEGTFGLPETEEELRILSQRLRNRMSVQIVGSRRRGITTFALTYRGDTDPQRTAKVANLVTDLYIAQNEDFRAGRAEKTADTIASLADNVKPELEAVEQEILEFIRAHRFETRADLPENQRLLNTARRDIELMASRRATLDAKKQGLEAQLETARLRVATTRVDGSPAISIDSTMERIAALQRELDEMRIHYSELHPSYVKKKRELEELLREAREARANRTNDEPETPKDPTIVALEAQIKAIGPEYEALDVQEARLKKEIAEYRRRIAVQPEVQEQLDDLTARRKHLREKYQRLQEQAENAAGSVDLEEEQMLGRQMEVLERASVPSNPYAPDSKRYYALGVALGLLVFVGPLFARNLLNPTILSEEGLRSLSQLPVLVSIPNVYTTRGLVVRRMLKNVAFSVIACAVLVATKLLYVVNP